MKKMLAFKNRKRFLVLLKDRFWDYLDGFNHDVLNFDERTEMFQMFIDTKIDDLEEFCAMYTYSYHTKKNKLDDTRSKEKIYEYVYTILSGLREKGKL